MTMNTRRTVTHRTVTYRTVAALAGAVALALGSVTAANAIDFPFPHPGTPEPEPPRIERANFKPATINPVQNTTVGVGQPIIITFNQPPKNPGRIERFVSVDVFNSKKEHYDIRGYFRWWSPTQLRWRPTSFWPQHTTVRVKVGDSVRTFHIGARHVAVADDKSHMITVYSDGKVIRHVPTSMGKPGHETPNGTYYIGDKHRHIIMDSSTYGVPVTAPEGYRTDVDSTPPPGPWQRRGTTTHRMAASTCPWIMAAGSLSTGCSATLCASSTRGESSRKMTAWETGRRAPTVLTRAVLTRHPGASVLNARASCL